jgi:tetratricopeptide (TPR) repeat protein
MHAHAGGVQMISQLIIDPDDPRWIIAPRHNFIVSRLLNAAFGRIAKGARDHLAYVQAHALARQCLALPHSEHQNMLVNFILGLALENIEEPETAIDMASEAFYEALEAAHETGDFAVAVEVCNQLGAILRCRGRYEQATDFYEIGLMMLEELGGQIFLNSSTAHQFELGLGVSLLASGDYDGALLHLPLARALAQQSGDVLGLASVDLSMANIYTARGDPHAALPLVLAARDAFEHATTPSQRMMQGRLHAIAALALLDVAEVYARRGRNVTDSIHVEMAGAFAQQALNHVVDTDEPGAFYMGRIAQARYERLGGRMPSAIPLIEPLLADADRIHDRHLAIQMHTAIGQDYAARGEHELAREAYQRAFQVASACGAVFLGEYPKRELLRGSQDLN